MEKQQDYLIRNSGIDKTIIGEQKSLCIILQAQAFACVPWPEKLQIYRAEEGSRILCVVRMEI